MSMIQMNDVSKWYGEFKVLSGCTTSVAKGDVVVVCGPSGSGKSTLIKTVNGLEPFQEGSITVDDISVGDENTNLPQLRSQIGMVFQNFELFPHLSIIENIKLAQLKVLNRNDDEAKKRGMALLDRVGLADQADKFPAELSGGQQQRVAIARALVNKPSLILADEPTGNLDTKTSAEVMSLLQQLRENSGITIVLITHEAEIAAYGTRIIAVRDGLIVSDTPNTPVTAPLEEDAAPIEAANA